MTRPRFREIISFIAITLFLVLAHSPLARAQEDNEGCLDCHEGEEGDTEEGEIDLPRYERSVHGVSLCTDCHTDATDEHDDREEPLEKVECAGCHEDEGDDFSTGIHGQLVAEEDLDAPDCAFCHTPHYALSKQSPSSPTFPLNVPSLCAECHREGERSAVRGKATQQQILKNYTMSIHGKGLLKSGLVVSATCTSCHTPHMELPADDPRSTVNPENIRTTCAECHFGIYDELRTSVHSPEVSDTDERLPMCNDCHTSHTIQRVERAVFRFGVLEHCGSCHEDVSATYFQSYHGKITKLGGVRTAKCYDCHGAHTIQPVTDPRSALHADRIVETCRQCHAGSNAKFVQYLPHATYHDRENYPQLFYAYWLMTALLVGVFAFFGVHTALWFTRSLIDRVRGRREARDDPDPGAPVSRYYRRFQPGHIVLHLTVIVTFLTLALTGMTLKFPDTPFFANLVTFFGGPRVMGTLHRICGVITFAYFGSHLYGLAGKLWRREITLRGLFTEDYSLVPLPSDLRDMKNNFLWFVGLAPKPRFGRWTYWEKFDYMAVFWGVAVIGLTGLILWFPEAATLVLPGWMINVATVIHSDEALLAAGFIFTIHFFNTHLRPDKFPMDTVIFTGRMSLSELQAEHPREYERLLASGELEAHLVDEPPRWQSIAARVCGFTFLTLGLGIVAVILYSVLPI